MVLSSIRRYLKQQIYFNFNNDWTRFLHVPLFFMDILKTITDTFKPWKSIQHRKRDADLYDNGLKKIKAGFVDFLIVLFSTAIACILPVFITSPFIAIPLALMALAAGVYLSVQCILAEQEKNWGIFGRVAGVVYGIGQVITSFRIPLRDYLSRGEPLKPYVFQDRKSVVELIKQADEIIKARTDNFSKEIKPVLKVLSRKGVTSNADSYIGKNPYSGGLTLVDLQFKIVRMKQTDKDKCIEDIQNALVDFRPDPR